MCGQFAEFINAESMILCFKRQPSCRSLIGYMIRSDKFEKIMWIVSQLILAPTFGQGIQKPIHFMRSVYTLHQRQIINTNRRY